MSGRGKVYHLLYLLISLAWLSGATSQSTAQLSSQHANAETPSVIDVERDGLGEAISHGIVLAFAVLPSLRAGIHPWTLVRRRTAREARKAKAPT